MERMIPDCLGPVQEASAPRWRLPPGSWDTHFHVLGPQRRFPYSASRKYTPPDAVLADCLRMHARLGLERGLVVHANTHGFDNRVDLDAVANSGGRYFAVVRLDASVTAAQCGQMHARGVRGVRFAFNPQHGGTLDLATFDHVCAMIAELGWFIELHFEGRALPELAPWLRGLRPDVVIDHIGRVDVTAGVEQEPFRILCELARRENIWIKVSGADRLTRQGPPYADVTPFARALGEICPERLLWGSDWPHTGVFDEARMPDDGALVDALLEFFPEESLRRRVLVDNPARLLGMLR